MTSAAGGEGGRPAAGRGAALRAAWVIVLSGACGAHAATARVQPPMGQLPTAPRVLAQPATLGGAAHGPRDRMTAAATIAVPRRTNAATIRPPAAMHRAATHMAVRPLPMRSRGRTRRAAVAPRRANQGRPSSNKHAP